MDADQQRPTTMLQMRSVVRESGVVEVDLEEVAVPTPSGDEVLIRVEAAPINPSDLGVIFAGADLSQVETTGTASKPMARVPISPGALRALAGRVEVPVVPGNEGAGVVVAAGPDPAAQVLIGRTVGAFGGAMYAQHRCVPAAQCLALPDGVTPSQGAAAFVNPLTALGMVGTMRREGHRGLVHTAAASNLGQMLNRLCRAEEVPLVNIVRRPEQVELLREQGATHVCDSSSESFREDLTDALRDTGATLAFDAIGGGTLAGQILAAMEAAALSTGDYQRYGSTVHKQVYIYGGLDRSPTVLNRTFGMAWGLGGWLLMPFLAQVGAAEAERLRDRVAAEITTTFASEYAAQVSLVDALRTESIAAYGRQATGEKYLILPNVEVSDE